MSIKRFSKVKWFAGALALLAVGVVAGDWWAHRMMSEPAADSPASAGNGTSPRGAAAGSGKPLYWYDPMIPGQHSEKPGKSPMGMEMLPSTLAVAYSQGSRTSINLALPSCKRMAVS